MSNLIVINNTLRELFDRVKKASIYGKDITQNTSLLNEAKNDANKKGSKGRVIIRNQRVSRTPLAKNDANKKNVINSIEEAINTLKPETVETVLRQDSNPRSKKQELKQALKRKGKRGFIQSLKRLTLTSLVSLLLSFQAYKYDQSSQAGTQSIKSSRHPVHQVKQSASQGLRNAMKEPPNPGIGITPIKRLNGLNFTTWNQYQNQFPLPHGMTQHRNVFQMHVKKRLNDPELLRKIVHENNWMDNQSSILFEKLYKNERNTHKNFENKLRGKTQEKAKLTFLNIIRALFNKPMETYTNKENELFLDIWNIVDPEGNFTATQFKKYIQTKKKI